MSLAGKVIILTGASRGIGLEAARALSAEGARVYGVARTAVDPSKLADGIIMFRADVRDRSQVTEVVRTVLEDAGRIDVLINNAGVEVVKPLADIDDEEYDQVLDTNLRGAFLFTSAVIPSMQRQQAGHIVFVNSVSGIRGFADDAIYCASKHALTGLADALDEELRPRGIRITSIHPGATDTTLALNSWAPADDPRRPYFLKAEDVAAAIVYAVSQPPRVVVKQIVIQPLIEPPHSEFLPLEVVQALLDTL